MKKFGMRWYSGMNSIICDIDGVILETPRWYEMDDFYQNLDQCVPNDWAVSLINGLHNQHIKIIFLTARDEKCRSYTKYQLEQLFDFNIHLYMRTRGDEREDYIVKAEHVERLLKKENILFAIDDNYQNCLMFNQYKIPSFHVQNI